MGILNRDGVALHYEEAGSGEPPVVFVHGWCCDHTYFAPQFERFARDHRVVAVDLRGHGASDKPEQPYTVEGFADDVNWMCGELGLARPILVGHSMGGATVLQLAASFPDTPSAVVMVDPAPLIPVAGFRDAVAPFVDVLRGDDYLEAARGFVAGNLFLAIDDAEVKARVVDQMCSAPQHVMVAAIQNLLLEWDGEAAAARVHLPTLLVSAIGSNETDMARLRELLPDLVFGQTVGAGHFHQLLVPDQVNAMIERFFECLDLSSVASPA
jgi:pimeloyl-ACP methyl ester carboxylesterase